MIKNILIKKKYSWDFIIKERKIKRLIIGNIYKVLKIYYKKEKNIAFQLF